MGRDFSCFFVWPGFRLITLPGFYLGKGFSTPESSGAGHELTGPATGTVTGGPAGFGMAVFGAGSCDQPDESRPLASHIFMHSKSALSSPA